MLIMFFHQTRKPVGICMRLPFKDFVRTVVLKTQRRFAFAMSVRRHRRLCRGPAATPPVGASPVTELAPDQIHLAAHESDPKTVTPLSPISPRRWRSRRTSSERSEDFGTLDLKDAKALLDQLALN
jgi:hypothetical protein